MAASLITRLPADRRVAALQRLSRNFNAPGAGVKQSTRAPRRDWQGILGNFGIFLIESNQGVTLNTTIGGRVPAAGGPVTLDLGVGATPATVDIDTNELETVVYGGTGPKTIAVTAPATMQGGAIVPVT